MNKIVYREKNNVLELEYAYVNYDVLYQVFRTHCEDTIYVRNGKKIIGVITFGSFKRNIHDMNKVINEHFTSIRSKNIFEASMIFEKHPSFQSVPVIDKHGILLGEFMKQQDLKEEEMQVLNLLDEILENSHAERKRAVESLEFGTVYVLPELREKYQYKLEAILGKQLKVVEESEYIPYNLEQITILTDQENERFYQFFYELNSLTFPKMLKSILERISLLKTINNLNEEERKFLAALLSGQKDVAVLEDDVLFLQNKALFEKISGLTIHRIKKEDLMVDLSRKKITFLNETNKVNAVLCTSYFMMRYFVSCVQDNRTLEKIDFQRIFKEINRDRYILKCAEYLESQNVSVVLGRFPALSEVRNLVSDFKERFFIHEHKGNSAPELTELPLEFVKKFYGEDYCEDYYKQMTQTRKEVIYTGDIPYLKDLDSELFQMESGRRVTKYNPVNYQRTIYCFGECYMMGDMVEDAHTIPSYLQDKLNKLYPDVFRVVNCGVWGDIAKKIQTTSYREGDIVFLPFENPSILEYMECGFMVHHFVEEFIKIPDVEYCYTNKIIHCNKLVMNLVAQEFLKWAATCLKKQPLADGKDVLFKCSVEKKESQEERRQIEEYKRILLKNCPTDIMEKKAGAIVMNCNPFTYGHQYLIGQASKMVDYLFIFVVEENLSLFDFDTRLDLVRKGTEKFGNVSVFPSGRFILSKETFPEYFVKADIQNANIDTRKDITIFAEEIAPCLNVKYRFVGEEIKDKITRQYNECMQEILPDYGIEVIEMKRKECAGDVISASTVRKNLKAGNWNFVKKLVPDSTYEYLHQTFLEYVDS